jgi:hypothetical protein
MYRKNLIYGERVWYYRFKQPFVVLKYKWGRGLLLLYKNKRKRKFREQMDLWEEVGSRSDLLPLVDSACLAEEPAGCE